ncbi:hypothetical protein SARC_07323 [Sphaeroforma arctica JP610]|uniref:Amino acid transporter transmembrane domain-containing protein n=1 Tax=Sphaeroforma arctica JP610 TaxID=667725 RepID=A0A0L0FTY9_9EUKA|nr:hypothetical protein SARC_07323 [Sphaeroforma arctica JP610]KNC80310.1 hypothetical protein SARC_07323 [Sphaeroforma arctica JP610]|eukprot:XP_014154212.1 hypothetical protein SARC_07323 [Sphaeroforma arctica JP610]
MTTGINVVNTDDSKSVSSKSTECQLLDSDYDSKGSQVHTDNNNHDETIKYTGLLGTVMNLTVSIIGGAIYALPYSAAQVGWSIAIGLMVFGAVLTWFGIHLLGSIANIIGNRQTTFGLALEMSYPCLTIIVDLVVVFLGWCVAVVYLTVASTVMPNVMADFMDVETQSPSTPIFVEAWFWLAIFWVGLALPLSMTRTLFFVAPAALAAVICVGYTAFISFGYLVGIFDPCAGVSASCQGEVDVAV